jgi:hypothetical protein
MVQGEVCVTFKEKYPKIAFLSIAGYSRKEDRWVIAIDAGGAIP